MLSANVPAQLRLDPADGSTTSANAIAVGALEFLAFVSRLSQRLNSPSNGLMAEFAMLQYKKGLL